MALVDGAAAALDAAAARGRCDGATVAALQDLKEKLADHMDHEEGEIFPLLAEIPERELKRMAGLVLGVKSYGASSDFSTRSSILSKASSSKSFSFGASQGVYLRSGA